MALFSLPPSEAAPLMPSTAPMPLACMAPTVSTSGSCAIRAAISSHTAAVSARVASSSSETLTLSCVLSIAGMNVKPRDTASTTERTSSATEPSSTGALCRSAASSARA